MEMWAWVVQLLVGVVMTGIGFWVKSQRQEIQQLRDILARTREEYVRKEDLRELKTEMTHRFDKLEELIRAKE